MLSLRKAYVIIAKTTFETPKPISFEDHSVPVESTTFLIAYQKHKPMGIAKSTLEVIGLFFHQLHTN